MKARRVLQEREGWKCASIMPGELSATVCLAQRMLQLLANNWEDSTERVNKYRLQSVTFINLPVVTMITRYILYIMTHLQWQICSYTLCPCILLTAVFSWCTYLQMQQQFLQQCLAEARFSWIDWTAIRMMSPYWSVAHFLATHWVSPSVTTCKM